MGGKEYWRGRGRAFVTANEDRWSVMPHAEVSVPRFVDRSVRGQRHNGILATEKEEKGSIKRKAVERREGPVL